MLSNPEAVYSSVLRETYNCMSNSITNSDLNFCHNCIIVYVVL